MNSLALFIFAMFKKCYCGHWDFVLTSAHFAIYFPDIIFQNFVCQALLFLIHIYITSFSFTTILSLPMSHSSNDTHTEKPFLFQIRDFFGHINLHSLISSNQHEYLDFSNISI